MPCLEAQSPMTHDRRRRSSSALIDKCVHCGFCLPTCPTYLLWGEEMDSPRGRIYLMKAGIEGRAEMTASFVEHFDRCLGCLACVTACPSGVQYAPLIEKHAGADRASLSARRRRRTVPVAAHGRRSVSVADAAGAAAAARLRPAAAPDRPRLRSRRADGARPCEPARRRPTAAAGAASTRGASRWRRP